MSKNRQVKKSTNKEEIKRLYFEEHLSQVEIAEIFKVSKQAINKVIKKDSKLAEEKEYRHNLSIENKKNYNNEYSKTYKRKKSTDTEEYYAMQAQLNKDFKMLSTHHEISDETFAQSNSSIYKYDNKGNKILIDSIKSKITNDVPRFIPAIKIPVLEHRHHV